MYSLFFTTHKISGHWNFMFLIKVMLGVTSGSELSWNRKDWALKKWNTMWILIQLPANENCIKFNFRLTLKLPEVMRKPTFIIKKVNSESISELKNLETEVSLKQYLKKTQFLEETIYSRNLHHLPLQILKVFLAIIDNFSRQFFFVRQS